MVSAGTPGETGSSVRRRSRSWFERKPGSWHRTSTLWWIRHATHRCSDNLRASCGLPDGAGSPASTGASSKPVRPKTGRGCSGKRNQAVASRIQLWSNGRHAPVVQPEGVPHDASHFRHLSHVTLYVPDLQVAVAYYQAFGLRAEWVAPSEPGSGQRARLSFPGGGPSLEVHTDARRQFTDVQLAVANLDDAYRALSRQPAVVWLEPPRGPAGQRRATLRGPDGNVLILGEATRPFLRND